MCLLLLSSIKIFPLGGLVVPSSDLMELCTLIEAEFLNNIEGASLV